MSIPLQLISYKAISDVISIPQKKMIICYGLDFLWTKCKFQDQPSAKMRMKPVIINLVCLYSSDYQTGLSNGYLNCRLHYQKMEDRMYYGPDFWLFNYKFQDHWIFRAKVVALWKSLHFCNLQVESFQAMCIMPVEYEKKIYLFHIHIHVMVLIFYELTVNFKTSLVQQLGWSL